MFIFYFNVDNVYTFTEDSKQTFLMYRESKINGLAYFNEYLVLSNVYLIVSLLYFLNFPLFNKHRQIFDSIFLLYDCKYYDTITCEKQALENTYTSYFINFDGQSELYYKYSYYYRFKNFAYSEVN